MAQMKEWIIHCKVLEVDGCHSSFIVTKSLLSVTCSVLSAEVKSSSATTACWLKNRTTHGADFTAVLPTEPTDKATAKPGEKGGEHKASGAHVTVLAHTQPETGVVLLKVCERLVGDLTRHVNGRVEVALKDLVVTDANSHGVPRNLEPMVLRLTRKNLLGQNAGNGTVKVLVWYQPARSAFPYVVQKAMNVWRWVVALQLAGCVAFLRLCLGVRVIWALFYVSPVWGPWLYLEAPLIVGWALTKILALAAPFLGLSMSAVRLSADFVADEPGFGSDLWIRIGVDDFALANDPTVGFVHKNFLAVKRVELGLAINMHKFGLGLWGALKRSRAAERHARRCAKSKVPTAATHVVLSLSGTDLTAKDEWITQRASSDPFVRIMVLPDAAAATEQSANGVDLFLCTPPPPSVMTWGERRDIDETMLDAHAEIARTEVVQMELNPTWKDMVIPLTALEAKLRKTGETSCIFVCYDDNLVGASNLIGASSHVPLLPADGTQPNAGDEVEFTIQIYKEGEVEGTLRVKAKYVEIQSHSSKPPPAIAWSMFPSVHDELRRSVPEFAPTRLFAVKFTEFKLTDVTMAFDIASSTGEFSLINFTRRLDQHKVRDALPKACGGRLPNTLQVTVKAARCDKFATAKRLLKTVVKVREQKQTSSLQAADDASGVAAWGEDGRFEEMRVVDPGHVLHVRVYEERLGLDLLVGQWIVTLKMIVVAPTNVRGTKLTSSTKVTQGNGEWELSGVMELRDATWTRVTGDCELAVRWYHDPAGPDYAQLLAANPKKCMDQIQGNGPDGDLKMGNLSQMINMLHDCPILLDFRAFEINKLRVHLKALFMGFKGEAKADPDSAVFIRSLNLHDKLAAKEGEDGRNLVDLLTLVGLHAVRPILAKLDLVGALGSIGAGVAADIGSSFTFKKPANAEPGADVAAGIGNALNFNTQEENKEDEGETRISECSY